MSTGESESRDAQESQDEAPQPQARSKKTANGLDVLHDDKATSKSHSGPGTADEHLAGLRERMRSWATEGVKWTEYPRRGRSRGG